MKEKTILPFEKFSTLLNDAIFGNSKLELLRKIADKPNRFIGIFRPTKPAGKILQHLLQSHEIRFGNTIETIITDYLVLCGAELLPNRYHLADGSYIDVDLCFKYKNKIYVTEMKIRDDHDSTKIRGQSANFELKIDTLLNIHKDERFVVGMFYFIDPGLVKSKSFYLESFDEIKRKLGVQIELCYGGEFFAILQLEEV